MKTAEDLAIGVIVVTYCSEDIIVPCLESLLQSDHPALNIVVCDNASPDRTVERIRSWIASSSSNLARSASSKKTPTSKPIEFDEFLLGDQQDVVMPHLAKLTLLRSKHNRGFAGGVNVGLKALLPHRHIKLFWLLNPDTVVVRDTASAYAKAAAKKHFGLMGGRTLYYDFPNRIQSDGGQISLWTGACRNMNQGILPAESVPIDPRKLGFISGANLVASRRFVEQIGPMREDYFLYYEEVDWASRRGDLSLVTCPEAVVYHHGGTVIGTGSIDRRPSALASYFNFRNRIRYVMRFSWFALPFAYFHSLLKLAKLACLGAFEEFEAALRGLHQLPPPAKVADQLLSGSFKQRSGKWRSD